jgi:hypothetical protein
VTKHLAQMAQPYFHMPVMKKHFNSHQKRWKNCKKPIMLTNNTGNIEFAIARFNTNGTVDLSFGYLLTIGLGGD